MSRVLMLVEGSTERAIVDQVFAPALGAKGVYLYPRVVGKPGHKGGNRFTTVLRELKALIRQESNSTVTMLFDYYGLKDDWPGLSSAKGKQPHNIPGIIEPEIEKAVRHELGATFNSEQFIPYIQMHEIEALLFAGSEEMAIIFEEPTLAVKFDEIVEICGGCENINDDLETAPSKRIQQLYPAYRKGSSVNAHAYRIAQHIGLDKIRQKCSHFDEWITKLEQLT